MLPVGFSLVVSSRGYSLAVVCRLPGNRTCRTHFEMRSQGLQLPLHPLLRFSEPWLGGKQAAMLGRGAVARPTVRPPGTGESGLRPAVGS